MGRGVGEGVDLALDVVVVYFVGFKGAVGVIIEQRSPRRMNVNDGLAAIGFLSHALKDGLHAGQVVRGGGVEDDVILRYILGDEFGIVEVADDCFGAGLLETICVLLATDETGHFIAFCYEEVEDGPAD